jgi:hypothetical protein
MYTAKPGDYIRAQSIHLLNEVAATRLHLDSQLYAL